MGAPEVTAAERTSSVPSWMVLGTGVKVLRQRLTQLQVLSSMRARVRSRGSLVVGSFEVGLVGVAGRASNFLLAVLGDRALEALGGHGHRQTGRGGASQNAGNTLGSESSHDGLLLLRN